MAIKIPMAGMTVLVFPETEVRRGEVIVQGTRWAAFTLRTPDPQLDVTVPLMPLTRLTPERTRMISIAVHTARLIAAAISIAYYEERDHREVVAFATTFEPFWVAFAAMVRKAVSEAAAASVEVSA